MIFFILAVFNTHRLLETGGRRALGSFSYGLKKVSVRHTVIQLNRPDSSDVVHVARDLVVARCLRESGF